MVKRNPLSPTQHERVRPWVSAVLKGQGKVLFADIGGGGVRPVIGPGVEYRTRVGREGRGQT